MQIRKQLATTQKKDLSMADYFNKMKGFADALAATGYPLREEEISIYILTGLDTVHDPLVTSITNRSDPITLNDLYAHMLSYEMRQEISNSSFHLSGRVICQHCIAQQSRWTWLRPRTRQPADTRSILHQQWRDHKQTCLPSLRQGGSRGIEVLRQVRQSYQVEDGLVAASASIGSYSIDSTWYTDSGATDQITSELDRMTVREKYHGRDQVHTASGSGSCHEENTSSRPK